MSQANTTIPTSHVKRLPSLRVLITLIVVIPVAIVAGALVTIAILTARQIGEQLGDEIVDTANNAISADVREYLGSAMRVSDQYARRVKENQLPADELAEWAASMFIDLAASPDVASICFANPRADATWLLRAHGRLEYGIVKGEARDKAMEFETDADGNIDWRLPLRVYRYDALSRPWYQTAVESNAAVWTPIYFWFQDQDSPSVTGTGYTRKVLNANGSLMGVLVIDVTLGAISTHLKTLPIASSLGGSLYIVDEKNLLVAASDGSPVTGFPQKRIHMSDSTSPAAKAIADLVTQRINGAEPAITAPGRVEIDGRINRVQVTEIKPFPGIHWHIVTVLPESSFLSSARSLQKRAILLAIGAVVGGTALGLILSRKLSRPLMRLTEHVARVGGGDFNSRLTLGSASELQRLSDEVNTMASGLKHRMQLEQSINMAMQVQQSLLPATIPALSGLEISACSKYCDSTGGDYYDFIECNHFPCHQTLIAVGDVTGHGIAAAMMMSSARGAIRASCQGAASLGHILTQVNQVLANGANGGMFMTLMLVFIDPETGYIHWSNAGHDPVIAYNPALNRFDDLTSGDIPLGIEEETVYREFSRKCAAPGTILMIGTDGIWEARNASGEMFGKDRLREVIQAHHNSAEAVGDAIKSAMYAFAGEVPLRDDATFVVIRVKDHDAPKRSAAMINNAVV